MLVPRPETEHLVEVALDLPHGARVVDVGTGSGAVALALKTERPDLHVTATDSSADALAVARANARRLGLDVPMLEGDLLDPVDGPLDAVLSNPPYVADTDRASLAPDITSHEPDVAVFAGADGLDLVRRLIPQAAATGAKLIALEIGDGAGARGRGADARGRVRRHQPHRRPRGHRARRGGAPVTITSADAETFERCIHVGGVAVFPADTVYGLACEPDNPEAVQRLYALKGRRPTSPPRSCSSTSSWRSPPCPSWATGRSRC